MKPKVLKELSFLFMVKRTTLVDTHILDKSFQRMAMNLLLWIREAMVEVKEPNHFSIASIKSQMIASNSIRRFKNFLVRMCHATF
jgi:hypothetical protein